MRQRAFLIPQVIEAIVKCMDDIAWHPAFLQAVELEFEAYLDVLDFEAEHQLTSEPLKIDVIIIKKKKDAVIDKPLGRIFRQYNLLEFKSPTDYLSVNDFYKVYGYACLYKSLKGADIKELTVSFAETKYPRKLQKVLNEVKGTHKIDTSAYRDVILRANTESMREVLGMGNLTLEQVLEETGWAARWEKRGEARAEVRIRREEKVQNARNLKKIGVPLNQIAEGLELTIEEVIQA